MTFYIYAQIAHDSVYIMQMFINFNIVRVTLLMDTVKQLYYTRLPYIITHKMAL
jgi:hypothetical protein